MGYKPIYWAINKLRTQWYCFNSPFADQFVTVRLQYNGICVNRSSRSLFWPGTESTGGAGTGVIQFLRVWLHGAHGKFSGLITLPILTRFGLDPTKNGRINTGSRSRVRRAEMVLDRRCLWSVIVGDDDTVVIADHDNSRHGGVTKVNIFFISQSEYSLDHFIMSNLVVDLIHSSVCLFWPQPEIEKFEMLDRFNLENSIRKGMQFFPYDFFGHNCLNSLFQVLK